MDYRDKSENGMKSKSFRYEDYSNRRVFLRSYPLQWEGPEGEESRTNEEKRRVTKNSEKKPIQKIIVSIIHWGEGKIVILRSFKHKVTVHVTACIPASIKSRTARIST